ncbi:MAG: TetR/AcrR family transcriptional regulator [Deltaproteobacteria bacterium]|nr:TetR/AcrR family transcriptional regulator [Deltaproteobacteria bacterium]
MTEDGRVRRARELKEARKHEILKTARRLFAKKGYERVSIDDIIDACGIARATFYAHFDTKRALFGELLDRLISDLKDAFVRVDVVSNVPHFEQLLANVSRLVDVLQENSDLARVVVLGEGGGDRELQERVREFHGHAKSMIKRALVAGTKLGLLREMDLDVAASAAVGAMKETIASMLVEGPRSKAARTRIAKELLEYNLFGLLAR